MQTTPLIVRCGALGDMVLLTALIRGLSARFGSADILTSGPWSEPLLRGQPGVGEVITIRSRKTPYCLSVDQHRAVGRLRRRGVGPTWYCDGNDAARRMLVRAGISRDYIVDVADHPLLAGEHATQQWCRLARALPAALRRTLESATANGSQAWPGDLPAADPAACGGCHLEVGAEQRADLEIWLKGRDLWATPLIAVQVGNKRTMRRGFKRLAANHKHWPNDRWAEVIRHIGSRNPDHWIMMLGAGPEHRLNAEIAHLAGSRRLINAAGDLPVPRLMALLARARGLVSVDSGPAHVAAAVGCPQVVLFGKASTSLYRPWGTAGADVTVLTGELDGAPNMLGIDTRAVTDAWDSLTLRGRC